MSGIGGETDVATADQQTLNSDGQAAVERERIASRRDVRDPDVLVDLPQLRVEEVNLEVDDLRASVRVQANVLDLLRLSVSADASLARVQVGVNTVDAQATVKLRLDDLAAILDRVLTTIDRNPQIIERLVQGVSEATEEVGQGAGRAVGEVGEGASSAVQDVGRGAGQAVGEVGEGAGSAAEGLASSVGAAGKSKIQP